MWQIWLPTALFFLAALWKYWGETYMEIRRHLRHFPGPKTVPLLGNLLDFGLDFSQYYYKALNLWKQHGAVFRLWVGPVPAVLLSDPRDIEVLLSDSKNLDKGHPYQFVEPWLGKGLLTSTGAKWHKHRKIITPTFHFKILDQFTEIFNSQGDALISNLREHVNKGSFDVTPYIDLYTQDVICETAMGVKINAQRKDENSSAYVNAVKRQTEYIVERSARPWLFIEPLFRISSLWRKQAKNLAILHGTTRKVIAERKLAFQKNSAGFESRTDDSGIKKKFAFLDLLLLSALKDNSLSEAEIREEVDTFMFEGHDTTSRAVGFILYELSKRADVQKNIFEELRAVMGKELNLTLDNLNNLKYTECVIKEGLRLYPSVPIYTRKLKYNMDLKTKNLTVPAGCTVGICPVAVHRHPEFFADPDEFKPERFSPENSLGRHAYAYIPFSAGPRNCIGQKFALLEMKSVIGKIIWNFQLQEDQDYEPHLLLSITLNTSNGIKVKIVPRKKD